MRLFNEVIAVERTLLQQIVAAVEPSYLQALRDSETQRIKKTIPEVFEYLFDTYGDITIEDIRLTEHSAHVSDA